MFPKLNLSAPAARGLNPSARETQAKRWKVFDRKAGAVCGSEGLIVGRGVEMERINMEQKRLEEMGGFWCLAAAVFVW